MKKCAIVCSILLLLIAFAGCVQPEQMESIENSTVSQAITESTQYVKPEGEKTAMDHIWEITDEDDFVIALSDYIAQKCNYGYEIAALSEAERVFFIAQSLEMEVNNGGFNQFFFNSAGNFSGELVAAFEAIGAVKTAEICQRALDAFGCQVPADRTARQDLLEELEGTEFDDILDQCDSDFYDYEENLNALNYAFVMKHKDQFH